MKRTRVKTTWTKAEVDLFRERIASFCARYDGVPSDFDGWILFPSTALGMRLNVSIAAHGRYPTIFVQFADGELAKKVYCSHPRLNQFHGGKFNFHFEPGSTSPTEAVAEFVRDIDPVFSEGAWGIGEAEALKKAREGRSWFEWRRDTAVKAFDEKHPRQTPKTASEPPKQNG